MLIWQIFCCFPQNISFIWKKGPDPLADKFAAFAWWSPGDNHYRDQKTCAFFQWPSSCLRSQQWSISIEGCPIWRMRNPNAMAVCRECFWQEPSGCALSKEPWCRSKESLLSRWFQVVTVEGADPSGESFPAHQIPSFMRAGWKHMVHIIQQKGPAAGTEPGHVQIITHWEQSQPLHGLETLPHTTPLSLGCDKLGKGRQLVPCRATSHTPKVSVRRYIPLLPLCQSSFSNLPPVCSLTVHQDPTLPHHPCRMCYLKHWWSRCLLLQLLPTFRHPNRVTQWISLRSSCRTAGSASSQCFSCNQTSCVSHCSTCRPGFSPEIYVLTRNLWTLASGILLAKQKVPVTLSVSQLLKISGSRGIKPVLAAHRGMAYLIDHWNRKICGIPWDFLSLPTKAALWVIMCGAESVPCLKEQYVTFFPSIISEVMSLPKSDFFFTVVFVKKFQLVGDAQALQ